MPRYIDADALKESLKNLEAKGNNQKYVQGLQDAIDGYFPQIIDNEPTADVEPARHEFWIHDGEDRRCSDCKAIIEKNEWCNHNWNFCYHCGARMDKEEEK